MLFRLGATPSSRSFPCEPEVCVFSLRAVFLLALLMLISVYIFLLLFLPIFSISIWTVQIICFILSFSCRYYSMIQVVFSIQSPRVQFLLRLVLHIIYHMCPDVLRTYGVYTYADITFLFLSEVHTSIVCTRYVLSSVFFCFPPEGIFRSN